MYLGDGVHLKKAKDVLIDKEDRETYNKQKNAMKSVGYVLKSNQVIDDIKNLKTSVDTDLSNTDSSPNDTRWKKTYKDFKLTWKYTPFKSIKILAYAPSGGYDQAWTGILHAIKYGDNYCLYKITDIKASHSSINLIIEDITRKVNGKPTMEWVEGNADDGFLYQIDWFDDNFLHELQCVDSIYSKDKLEYFINLARMLDKNE